MVCRCGHSDHAWDEPRVCKTPSCRCINYEEAIGDNSVMHNHLKYLDEMEKTEDKVRYLLTNIKFLRNFPNKEFVFAYWAFCDGFKWNRILTKEGVRNLTDPESIRRSKQKLVEKNPDLYGPNNEIYIEEKYDKQTGIIEYVLTT